MDCPSLQSRVESAHSGPSFIDSCCLVGVCITVARVADWVHGEIDELDEVISCLPIVLRPGESVEKTLPFCVEWVDILDFDVPEKRFDLVACQTLTRVCKYAARYFKRL